MITVESAIQDIKLATGVSIPVNLLLGVDTVERLDDQPYFAGIGHVEEASKWVITNRWDDFNEMAPSGYLAFGHAGHGANSWAVCLQWKTSTGSGCLRLPCGGWFMGDKEVEQANSYLRDLAAFSKRCDIAGVALEVVEDMGEGRYRVFERGGEGVELNSTLAADSSRASRLNLLLADLALRATGSAVLARRFSCNSSGLVEWQEKNEEGSVLVFTVDARTSPEIHSSGCSELLSTLSKFDEATCSDHALKLQEWSSKANLGEIVWCPACFEFMD